MVWATLLHFYQPFGQKKDIVDAITEQCYRPVVEGLLAHPEAKITVNFTGVLLEQLSQYGHEDVIELWREAVRRGQVELVSSAKYHVILPLLPREEARRQIEIHDETNRKFFGELYQPKGIFLPEMGWSPDMAPMLEELGLEWVMLDELAFNGKVGEVDYTTTYEVAGTKLGALFREHRLSATIMSAAPRDVQRLKEAVADDGGPDRYIVTGMDGETFGHHRVGHEQLLFGMFGDPEIEMVRLSDIFARFPGQRTAVPTLACTWASSADDLAKGIPFISWDDPSNEIHKLQWRLLRLAVREMARMKPGEHGYERLRAKLDNAVSSDQFFWAAARPWWMIEHIERGAYELLDVLQHIPEAGPEVAAQGLNLYHEIMAMAYDWQRSGKIDAMFADRAERVRIPFKEKTAGAEGEATWRAIIDLMHERELAARERADYEEAILWRDAVYKLEHKLDIYDAWYVLDILRHRLPKGKVEETIKRYRAEFDRIRGGQVEQRSN
ncbi:MAG TPA: hypothetical protein VI322_05030 [Candidatus Saccharimonadia bacterium]